jgi:hypothetical protein
MWRTDVLIKKVVRIAVVTAALLAPATFGEHPAMGQGAGWEWLGGNLQTPLSCTSWAVNRIDCFAQGYNFVNGVENQAIWHDYWNGSAWSNWQSLGGQEFLVGPPDPNSNGEAVSVPTCVSWGENRIDCFQLGVDRGLWHKYWNGSSWVDWEALGGNIASTASCTTWSVNRIDCFAVGGTDHALVHKAWNGEKWLDWENLGGELKGKPACVSWGPGRIDCFAFGTDYAIWHIYYPESPRSGRLIDPRPKWSGWERFSGDFTNAFSQRDTLNYVRYLTYWEHAPTCVSRGVGRIDCVVTTGGNVWRKHLDNSTWSAWEPQQIGLESNISCATSLPDNLDCFALHSDSISHFSWVGQSWNGEESLGVAFKERPTCLSWGPGRIDCFTRNGGLYFEDGVNGDVLHKYWDGSWQPPACPSLPTPLHGDGTDIINISVFPSGPDMADHFVNFDLNLGPGITWWKTLQIAGYETSSHDNDSHNRVEVPLSAIMAHPKLSLFKAKFLGFLSNVQNITLPITAGYNACTISITWEKDR